MNVTEKLMQEHRVIERVLYALERAATRLSRGEDVYLRFFIGTSVLINEFANSYHHKKEEAVLVNTARGSLIDETALIER